jgi:site-specific recombinase XerD
MYNTGARAQELVDLHVNDLKTDGLAQVKIKGKGRKERIVPIWEETVNAINRWIKTREQAGISAEHLFVNSQLV